MGDKEETVKLSLSDLLQKHGISESLSLMDDIVLSYILSILEELGHDSCFEDIDVDQLVEMISAYLPGFRNISSSEVLDWMFALASKLTAAENQVSTHSGRADGLSTLEYLSISHEQKEFSISVPGKLPSRRRTSSDSERDSKKTLKEQDVDRYREQMDQLLELFPNSCTVEIMHCLHMTNGDMDSAAQLVLHRQESGTCIKSPGAAAKEFPQLKVIEDKKLKELMLHRYGFVDTDEDKKTHIPPPLKQDAKKMVRYLGNQIVSTKGERYTELKKTESEEMKKTYVSLKPSRKYRFH